MTNHKLTKLLFLSFLAIQMVKAEEWVTPRLSPLPVELTNEAVSLNGVWQFNPLPGDKFGTSSFAAAGWENIEVPGEWVMQGFQVEKGKAAGYYRTFTVPSTWKGQRIKLRCNGIFSESTIYVNGMKAGYHLGGFTPFELDVTSLIQYNKDNSIAVEVISESIADSTASASKYAVHPLGGITRDIYLFALPTENLSLFHVTTTFDKAYADAVLATEVEVTNESTSGKSDLNLLFTLTDAAGKTVELKNNVVTIPTLGKGKQKNIKVSFEIAHPEQWNSEHPYLYHFTCTLRSGEQVLHASKRRVGFRQIEVRGNELFINNMPVKLRGVCRHEVMPLRGRSLADNIWKKDVELFRNANVNYIRTSHYPPDEALLEACDELGMFVEEEAPFCWAHETKVPEDKHYAVLVNQHIEMVNRDRSHPSVIIWSMGNESNLYTEYFKRSAELVKEMDPTRPRIFSQWGPDADNNELEIGNHHYPGPKGPDMYQNSKRPITFDEFCHLNAYNRLELAADPGVRSMWDKLLDKMWSKMYYSKGVLGGAVWAGIDDTFFLPGGVAVGYGTWGPIDGWRREKPEYWGMKKAFSPVRISLLSNADAAGYLHFQVENRHNFINLSACTVKWEAEGKEGIIALDVSPRNTDTFSIKLPDIIKNAANIRFSIASPLGYTLDEYAFQLLPKQHPAPILQKKNRNTLVESDHSIEVSLPEGRLIINKRNGLAEIRNKQGELLIKKLPSLMILPLNPEGEGIQMTGKSQNFKPYNQLCSNWICQSVDKKTIGNLIEIYINGTYKEAEGSFIYTIHENGELSLSYRFVSLQDVSPRQIGIVFTLPETFDCLSWEREGYWNVYPSNHISGLKGKVMAFDPVLPIIGIAGPDKEPANSWATDQTANGSNTFRSTKENILEVSLSDRTGNMVGVFSDGSQHARTWKEDQSICLLIADYNNPGNERFLVSHAESYYRPLKEGDGIQGTIRLSLK